MSKQKKLFRFQSTPSVGRATYVEDFAAMRDRISIHALRGEGDSSLRRPHGRRILFQSTPSVGRATEYRNLVGRCKYISIHALRGEGDCKIKLFPPNI